MSCIYDCLLYIPVGTIAGRLSGDQLKVRFGPRCQRFIAKVQRFDAVDGATQMTKLETI